jgi:hypothetical protein
MVASYLWVFHYNSELAIGRIFVLVMSMQCMHNFERFENGSPLILRILCIYALLNHAQQPSCGGGEEDGEEFESSTSKLSKEMYVSYEQFWELQVSMECANVCCVVLLMLTDSIYLSLSLYWLC